jgi:hypothetical protein
MISGWLSEERAARPDHVSQDTIVISDAMIARLADEWITRFGSAPTALEQKAMVDAEINDEILHREALRLDMHRVDPVVETRLTQNMRFLTAEEGAEAADDEKLLQEALALDMAATDIVVRRRLIQQMQWVLEAAAVPPSLQESRDYVREHPDRFATSPRFEISYRFERYSESGERGARVHSAGFTAKKLAQSFGSSGAEQITSLVPGEWTGPIRRKDGFYRVRLDGTIPAQPIEFELVRARAHHALMLDRRQAALHRALRQLRLFYPIRVGGEPEDTTASIRDGDWRLDSAEVAESRHARAVLR